MRPPFLAWRLPPTLCRISGVSFFLRSMGAFFLSYQSLSNPKNIARWWGVWDARLALLKMVLAFTISQDDGEGGIHVLSIFENGVGVWESWGGDISCDGVVVAIIVMCLCDCAYVRERYDVSSGSSWIYGIFHVRANNISYISGEISKMLFLDRSWRAASFITKNVC